MEHVKLEFDKRVFELLSVHLYRDKLSFLRELIQNSYDAGATRVVVELKDDMIIVRDNGVGMTYEFLKNDFRRVGKSFKTSDNQIGFYGIGRLSIWLVAERATIRSRNAMLYWNDISEYTLEKVDGDYKGTEFIIYLKKKLDYWDIYYYLRRNIALPIEIILKSGDIRKQIHSIAESFPYRYSSRKYKADVYFVKADGWGSLRVFENGLLVEDKLVNNINCIVNFHKRIRTLSRESSTISNLEIYRVLAEALLNMPPTSQRELSSTIVAVASYLYSHGDEGLAEQLAKIVYFGDNTLSFFASAGFYYSEPSPLVARARDKRFNVLVSTDPQMLLCFEIAGLRKLDEIRDQLIEEFNLHKLKDQTKKMLEYSNKVMSKLNSLVEDLRREVTISEVGKVLKEHHLEKIESVLKNMEMFPMRLRAEEGFTTLGNLAVGSHDDPSIVAFEHNGMIVFNVNSEIVKVALEMERFDILEEVILHEFVHSLGFKWHDDAFMSVYNYFRHKLLIERAKRTRLFEVDKEEIPTVVYQLPDIKKVRIEVEPIE